MSCCQQLLPLYIDSVGAAQCIICHDHQLVHVHKHNCIHESDSQHATDFSRNHLPWLLQGPVPHGGPRYLLSFFIGCNVQSSGPH